MEVWYWMILSFLSGIMIIINPKSQYKFDSNGSIESKISLNICIGKTGLYIEELIKNCRDSKEYLINFRNREVHKK